MATETKKVVFVGAVIKSEDGSEVVYDGSGDSHVIDLGLVTQGEKKGTARQRVSGSDVVKYLQTMVAAGRDAVEVVSALEGAKALALTDDGPRNEAHDEAFTAFLNGLRKEGATVTFTRSELTKKAVSSVGTSLGWKTFDEITAGAEALEGDFTAYMYEASAPGSAIFAKQVEKKKGQQQVTLKAR